MSKSVLLWKSTHKPPVSNFRIAFVYGLNPRLGSRFLFVPPLFVPPLFVPPLFVSPHVTFIIRISCFK